MEETHNVFKEPLYSLLEPSPMILCPEGSAMFFDVTCILKGQAYPTNE